MIAAGQTWTTRDGSVVAVAGGAAPARPPTRAGQGDMVVYMVDGSRRVDSTYVVDHEGRFRRLGGLPRNHPLDLLHRVF